MIKKIEELECFLLLHSTFLDIFRHFSDILYRNAHLRPNANPWKQSTQRCS